MRAAVFGESFVLGAIVTLLVVVRPPASFLRPPHVRTNYRGATVAGTLGVVLVLPLLAGGVVAFIAGASGRVVLAAMSAGVLLGLVGLIDDVYGDRRAGGLIGHARALVHGRVTTGTLKAATGVAVGLGVAWGLGRRGAWWIVAAAVIAMAANLANLLDVRPGRCIKVALASFVALAAGSGLTDGVLAAAGLAGGAAGFLNVDLRERAMLGDGGAAVLGATLGAAAVTSVGNAALAGIAAALAALTVASEAVSFSQVIERFPPLRFLDALGRSR
jgi:UDP-N-acetylmuramyl pentapeptide phosphotransferase/UDP-N-acetylglucosamine-1-phosphate transferase